MTFRERINAVSQQIDTGATIYALPNEPRCAQVARDVAHRHALTGVVAEPPDLDEIAARIRQTLHQRGGTALQRRDLKYAPHCLWAGREPIAETDTEATRRIVETIAERGRRSLITTLAVAYLRYYKPGRPGIKLVGRTLQHLAGRAGPGIAGLSRDIDIFDPADGPSRLAQRALNDNRTPGEILEHYGLSGDCLTTGLVAEAARQGMVQISRDLAAHPTHDTVELADHWAYRQGEIRFTGAKDVLAKTLVRPFLETNPPSDLRQAILDVLLHHLHDPRLYPQNWIQITDERDCVRRWLAGESLRQFLEIVDRTAQPSHWVYRRAFWKAFYDAELMTEAWVAFGPAGQREAHRVFGKHASFGTLAQTYKSVEQGHAVLLMRIGNLTICDWSHNGRCIIWPQGHEEAPRLYKATYRSGDLAPANAPEGGISVRHDGSDSYRWQRRIANFIRDKIGISVAERDFQVNTR